MKTSKQTASFAILFFLALFGTYSLTVAVKNMKLPENSSDLLVQKPEKQTLPENGTVQGTSTLKAANSEGWLTHKDEQYHFTFKYEPSWKVLPAKKYNDYNLLEIDPGKKFVNFKIYISDKNYFALEGLPFKTESLNGKQTIIVEDMIYGIKNGDLFYTFDLGASMTQKANFKALVESVEF